MTVTDIFHDIHLPVEKTSVVTARGSTVVSGLAVSKNKISFLPTDPFFFFAMLSETNIFFVGLITQPLPKQRQRSIVQHGYNDKKSKPLLYF
jgi:serine protease inhibitor